VRENNTVADPCFVSKISMTLIALYQQAQEKKEKMEGLPEEIKEKKMWDTALKKAQGVKVKDDATLIKKSIKRDLSKKRKSAKEWCVDIKELF
jgi:hypothetical protein